MTVFIGILLALFVFFVVVFLHELGHFVVARWSGVKVHEFGLGIPPRLLRLFRDKRWTEWTLNWFPLGGFVRLKWENFDDPESREKDALPQVPWWKQVAILLAGVIMNFLLAACLFATLFYQGTEPLTVHIRELAPNSLLSHVGNWTQLIPIFDTLEAAQKSGIVTRVPGVVLDPLPSSIAEKSGILPGDILLSINNVPLGNPSDIPTLLDQMTWPLKFEILRWSDFITLSISPLSGKIGAYIAPNILLQQYKYGFFSSLLYGAEEVYHQIGFSFRTFGAIIRTSFSDTASREQKQEATAGIGGPVAIGRVFVGLADYGVELRSVIVLTAMISLSLGVFNLLPFPALDGGRCLLVIVNQAIHVINPKFKISPRIEQMIHSLGFIILILASILVTWKDIFFHQ
jgi:regulator of sigma E protease